MTDPCVPPPTRPILPDGNTITLWPYHEVWPEAYPLLELAKPENLMFHGSAEWLVKNVSAYVDKARKALSYEPNIFLGIAADGDKVAAVERWTAVAELAVKIGAAVVQVNAEGTPNYQWTSDHTPMILEAYASMRAAAPEVHLSHTAWYSDKPFPKYPFSGFCGEGGADSTHPQIYLKGSSRSGLLARHEESRAAYSRMKRDGTIAEACEVEIYLSAAEANDTGGTLTLAPLYRSVCWWGFVPLTDEQGRRSLVGACLLRRLGYHGPGGVKRFQSDHGLEPDGYPGPATQRMLGLP